MYHSGLTEPASSGPNPFTGFFRRQPPFWPPWVRAVYWALGLICAAGAIGYWQGWLPKLPGERLTTGWLITLGIIGITALTQFFQRLAPDHTAWLLYSTRLAGEPARLLDAIWLINSRPNRDEWVAPGLTPGRLKIFKWFSSSFYGGDFATLTDRQKVLRRLARYSRRIPHAREVVEAYASFDLNFDPAAGAELAKRLAESNEAFAGGPELALYWETLLRGLGATTVPNILSMESAFQAAVEKHQKSSASREELQGALGTALDVIGQLRRYLGADALERQVAFLTKALSAAASQTKTAGRQPEGMLATGVLESWSNICRNTLEELQGTAQIRLSFETRQLEPAQELTLVGALVNDGRGYAEDVRIALLSGDDYSPGADAVDPAVMDMLPSNWMVPVHFRVKPAAVERFVLNVEVRFKDVHGENTATLTEQFELVAKERKFAEFVNPYSAGPPIREKDSPIFFGRDDVFRQIAQILDENVRKPGGKSIVLLVGERRMGKTSVLLQLDYQLEPSFVPVFLNVQGFNDPGDLAFVYWMCLQIERKLRERGTPVTIPTPDQLEKMPTVVFGEFVRGALPEVLAGRHIVLLFDEFEHMQDLISAGRQNNGVLFLLRDLMQHVPNLSSVFAGTYRLQEMASEYQSIMFNIAQTLKLDHLSEADARRLILEPIAGSLEFEPAAPDFIYTLTRGHPFFTQLLCYELVQQQKSRQKAYVTVTDVDDAARTVVEKGQPHFDYIYTTLTPPLQLLLSGVAAWLEGGRPVIASDAVSQLARYRQEASIFDISRQLEQLAQRGLLVETRKIQTAEYTFRMDLVRRWILRNRPFEELLPR